MIKTAIEKVVDGENLTEVEMPGTMNQIMGGDATPAQIGSFITALRVKGETIDEITGAVRVMRQKATKIKTKHGLVVDTWGTGGDGSQTFNVSTTVAFVVAGAGVPVAKHGNRAISSRSGSADVLKALGVNIEISPEMVGGCIDEIGIGFLFAPVLHGAMKHAIGPRREVGIRTVFNILGPLTNPAGAKAQVIGVYDSNLTEPIANVLKNLGCQSAFVVHGDDGLDEITTTTTTQVSQLAYGNVINYIIDPTEFGIANADPSELIGGTPETNADITYSVLNVATGPKRDITLINSAAAIVAGGKSSNIQSGLEIASAAIDSGKALEKLNALVEVTNR